jgi:ribose/xylose/arabinose/galactoside ABC-type transport system permease subunit
MSFAGALRSPRGIPQIAALLLVFAANWLVFPDFFALELRGGRLFGSLIDVLNRGAPVAILAIGMTLVIAARGIDLSVGAVMAIAGATAATLTNAGYGLPAVLRAHSAWALPAGCGTACWWRSPASSLSSPR